MNDNQAERLRFILKKHFGYDSFKPGQLAVLNALLEDKNVMAILPTGAGKTLIYQIYGLIKPNAVLIISPLISLMQDQVSRMQYLGHKNVIAFNSTLGKNEKLFVMKNIKKYKYIFISPEMLSDQYVQECFKKIKIDLFVVDEAHCISQWGIDFRPEYLDLSMSIKALKVKQVLMLTATASKKTRKDTIDKLSLNHDRTEIISNSVNRSNIYLSVQKFLNDTDKQIYLLKLISSLQGPGIVYFSSKKIANQMSELIKQKTSLRVEPYHSEVNDDDRYRIQHQFMNDKIDLVCATSAFGMGIDKNNIRYVIHYHLPTTLEDYMQEIGRAGRDGKQSIAFMLYQDSDINLSRRLALKNVPDDDEINFFFSNYAKINVTKNSDDKIKLLNFYYSKGYSKNYVLDTFRNLTYSKIESLNVLHDYVSVNGCLRKYLLRHFDESFDNHNDKCCSMNSAVNLKFLGLLRKNISKSSQNKSNWRDIINSLFYNVNM
ncbi:RecQ family ATP-dependent DNA helicase [Apilactobacillus ozensis]|uniref:RecQ family ATP-dependent DNA helicase n=1 Tax=Apilactobacillus ozensis TaxID=866801 RepID=UPI00200B4134|nr:RecQ family ATP-dependent DNA helicase [Apilactobacillus ozensis]MCK8606484.1 RecQ family ATP-dependent DNA helicase [Apilactobacillus ozensis]